MKKYELTDEKKTFNGKTLSRIRALRSFGRVSKGDLGGWVEGEMNLSHTNDAWIYDNAAVYDKARVSDDAKVLVDAKVYGNAKVYGKAQVYDQASIYGSAGVNGYSLVFCHAQVYDNARVYDTAQVYGGAEVYETARVYGDAEVCGSTKVHGDAEVSDGVFVENAIADSPIFINYHGETSTVLIEDYNIPLRERSTFLKRATREIEYFLKKEADDDAHKQSKVKNVENSVMCLIDAMDTQLKIIKDTV